MQKIKYAQPLYVDTANGFLDIIYEMHTNYHGLEIVEERNNEKEKIVQRVEKSLLSGLLRG